MRVVNYSQFRGNLAAYMDEAAATEEELLVTRGNDASVVVVSVEHWESLQETLHLARSPANAARLDEAKAELDAGKGIAFDPTQKRTRPAAKRR
ncbi:MAG: yefM [Rhodospirillales bacterium]|jgi:antitoxin YefM|nr:yefM [Rhodospirillales bacterium]